LWQLTRPFLINFVGTEVDAYEIKGALSFKHAPIIPYFAYTVNWNKTLWGGELGLILYFIYKDSWLKNCVGESWGVEEGALYARRFI